MTTAFGEISCNTITVEIIVASIVLVILLLLSGLISGSESAYFSLSPVSVERIKSLTSMKARLTMNNLSRPDKLLATILIANNFVNVGIVMLSAYLSTELFDFGSSTLLKFIFETIIITLIILFFGEVVPKIYSRQHNSSFAMFMAYPLALMQKLLTPFSFMLMRSTKVVNQRLSRHQQNMSVDDLSQAVELTGDNISEGKEMLEGIVNFANLCASDIMTPRLDVVSIDTEDSFNRVKQIVVDSGYSRIPVYNERPDDIQGILFVKDILSHLDEDNSFDWKMLLRKPYYIPETKKINELLAEFQTSKTHMAIVVDEYGGMSGIVTLEDVIEEIVGDISDEFDDEEKMWTRQPDGSIIFEGKISLNDFYKVTGIDDEEFEKDRGDAETLAGFLLELKGLIPKKQDTIKYRNYKFDIVAADARKITKIRYSEVPAK
ncbi:MAG: gliding motility-associated protein GldE [Bacteroidales bacterium]|nr:gliding motility-associated protein GldE [Bacteroidales bacterium]